MRTKKPAKSIWGTKTAGASSATALTSGTEQPRTTATDDEAMPRAQAQPTSFKKSPFAPSAACARIVWLV